jgi:hypothetical protein
MGNSRRKVVFKDAGSVSFSTEKLFPSIPDLQKYVSAMSFRNIFNPFEKTAESLVAGQAEGSAVVQRIVQKVETLRLVGISWLDTPESASAMVENTSSGVTYFLRSGEQVNGVTVEAIYADSIVLEFDGERMELKL